MPSAPLIVGFYGKLPARGDFVRAALPRDFTDPWDDWLQSVMAGSRTEMGEDWLPAYLEAPVWRFALPPGCCGSRAVSGASTRRRTAILSSRVTRREGSNATNCQAL